MAIAINREIAGDLNNPSMELLNYCMEQHLNNKARLEKLSNYYDGKQEILNRKKKMILHQTIKFWSIMQNTWWI